VTTRFWADRAVTY